MANYCAYIRSNYFAVTDEEKLRELMGSVKGEYGVHLFDTKMPDGTTKYAIGCDGGIYGLQIDPDDEDSENDLDAFHFELQKLLCEGDAIIITEVGYENLRYLVGVSTVITKSSVVWLDLNELSLSKAKELLGNPDFQTQMDY